MSLMKWTEEQYGTTVDIFDKQHQELFDLINALNDAVSGGNRPDIGSSLDAMIDYVVLHFKNEEKMMEERGYDGLAAHRQEHEKLISTCTDLQTKFHANEADVEESTMSFIKTWLDQHIPVIDRSYGPALAS